MLAGSSLKATARDQTNELLDVLMSIRSEALLRKLEFTLRQLQRTAQLVNRRANSRNCCRPLSCKISAINAPVIAVAVLCDGDAGGVDFAQQAIRRGELVAATPLAQ